MQSSPGLRGILRRSSSTLFKNSASNIRKTFIEYFVKEHSHKFVPSSSVKPHGDPSLAFVNAGMNQFKSVLLGTEEPVSTRVVNSQKCIRVGGKHNDLEAVGKDGTHHTFFEMLGNWSFADYFKRDACRLAWNLLTGPYGFDKNKLVVTYFGGHSKSNLSEDRECADIWRQLGLGSNQIIPNGMADNFWEMGPHGPCGPCTEIYFVDGGTIMELWNLVFIQYERKSDGLLYPLQKKHVDTGMGLERLARVLQGVQSNYDTDLFRPLIEIIQKNTNKSPYGGSFEEDAVGDQAYRILADHSRAITISLADGIFPDQNYKLRKLIRRCFSLSDSFFKKNGNDILADLLKGVTENLGESYPELQSNLHLSIEIIQREYDAYLQSRLHSKMEWEKHLASHPSLQGLPNDHPGLAQAVGEVKDMKEISGAAAFRLHDSLGLDLNLINKLAQCFNIKVDVDSLQELLLQQQQTSRVTVGSVEKALVENQIPPTNDQSKYFWEYNKGHYKFTEHLQCKVLALLRGSDIIENVAAEDECLLITNHTHLYHEAGGQVSDIGSFETPNGLAEIADVQKHGQYVTHKIKVVKGVISSGDIGKLILDVSSRMKCMQNHSATHLLNAAVHRLFENTYQRSSHVTPNYLTFDFSTTGALNEEQVEFIEDFVKQQIKSAVPIKRKEMKFVELPTDAVKIPGEDYPEVVSAIMIGGENLVSVEPCCGTHCSNTGDLKEFCITAEKSAGAGVRSLRAVVGEAALKAIQSGNILEEEVNQLKEYINSPQQGSFEAYYKIKSLRQKVNETEIPLLKKRNLLSNLEELNKKVTGENKIISREVVENHVKECLAVSKAPYIVSMITSNCPEPLSLAKGNLMCLPEKASLFISCDGDGFVRGRCAVPNEMVSNSFNAEAWMTPILKIFDALGGPPKGKDGKLVCLLKPTKVKAENFKKLSEKAVKEGENFAKASLLLSLLERKQ